MRPRPAMRKCEIASLTLACLLCAQAGCSGSSSGPADVTTVSHADSSPVAADRGKTHNGSNANVCDRRLLTAADVAGILGDSITGTRAVAGDVQSCEFVTSSFPGITVSVRPGMGRETVEAWSTGKMPLSSTPLEGIGETAVWQPDLHEVIAQKNDLLCDIEARGVARELAAAPEAVQKRIGALCNKIFAAD